MESDQEFLEASLKGLILLSIIPSVIFVIWRDYADRQIHELTKNSPNFDTDEELEKIRFGSLMVFVFQLLLYLGSEEVRKAYSALTEGILFVVVVGQMLVQNWAEGKYEPKDQKSIRIFPILAKATRAWLVASLVCILLSLIMIQASAFAAHRLHTSSLISTFLVTFGGVSGVSAGLFINYLLGPYHLLKIFPTSPLSEHPIHAQVQELFRSHGLKVPQLWVIEIEKLRIIDVLILGIPSGKGIFSYSLFISRSTLNQLSTAEVEALIKVQMSHVLLNHFYKRQILFGSLIVNSMILAILTALSLQRLDPGQNYYEFFGTIVGIFSFVFSTRWLSIQKENQEFSADVHSVENLKSQVECLTIALRKLDFAILKSFYNEEDKIIPMMGYPETERRIYLLQAYFQRKTQEKKDDTPPMAQAS